jgi:lipid-binding SYLF domain-containing protein
MTSAAVVAVALLATGCASPAPKTSAERQSLVSEADAAVSTMTAKDPSLRDFLDRSYGYVVFPNVGKGGAVVGGAYGRGVVFEQGRPIGFANLKQASIGAQLGGQTYSEVIAFQNQGALERIKVGDFDMGGEVSAVALKAGAARTAQFQGGMAVFVQPKGGLMAEASNKGQKINFEPLAQGEAQNASDRPQRPGSGGGASGSVNTGSGGVSGTMTTTQSSGSSSGGSDVKVDVNTNR